VIAGGRRREKSVALDYSELLRGVDILKGKRFRISTSHGALFCEPRQHPYELLSTKDGYQEPTDEH
jgi:hypothetical protein